MGGAMILVEVYWVLQSGEVRRLVGIEWRGRLDGAWRAIAGEAREKISWGRGSRQLVLRVVYPCLLYTSPSPRD